MGYSVTPEQLVDLVGVLRRPAGPEHDLSDWWRRILRDGWITRTSLGDFIYEADRRFGFSELRADDFAAWLGLGLRPAFAPPASRFDDWSAEVGLCAADAAAVLIFLERLGVTIDPSPLCAQLRPQIASKPLITVSERAVLFHHQERKRGPPVTISAEIADWQGFQTQVLPLAAGYRGELATNVQAAPLWITVKAPLHRPRPEPVPTTCETCGLGYMRGRPSDDREHRRAHRRWLAIHEPKPHRQFLQARERDALNAPWVDYGAAKWKRQLVADRALIFKRELGMTFLQWSMDRDANAGRIAYLFTDAAGRVVGTACFIPQRQEPHWRLTWVWITPSARRSGLLAAAWPRFLQQLGVFDVEPPLSEAMAGFLAKHAPAQHPDKRTAALA
jgi:hypothetical protein